MPPRPRRKKPSKKSHHPASRHSPRAPRLPKITLALEWFLNPDHLPFIVAKEQGFFREEGLDLSIVVPTVPEESLELVARCKADFCVGEQTNLIKARG